MKNQKKVRNYWGYYFLFEDPKMMGTFIKLYEDLFIDYEIVEYFNTGLIALKVVVGKGVIPQIKEGLGDLIYVKYRRYYVKAA